MKYKECKVEINEIHAGNNESYMGIFANQLTFYQNLTVFKGNDLKKMEFLMENFCSHRANEEDHKSLKP